MTNRQPPTLRAHANVIDIAEQRRQRQAAELTDEAVRIVFPNFASVHSEAIDGLARKVARRNPPPSHPAAKALLAGLMQGVGERDNDPALIDAGKRLADAAQKAQPAAPERRQRLGWLRAVLECVTGSRRPKQDCTTGQRTGIIPRRVRSAPQASVGGPT